jgi:hypothetical protein
LRKKAHDIYTIKGAYCGMYLTYTQLRKMVFVGSGCAYQERKKYIYILLLVSTSLSLSSYSATFLIYTKKQKSADRTQSGLFRKKGPTS